MSFILVYVTHPDINTADRISKVLLEEKLIACSNTIPIKSVFWWESNIQNENEIVTIFKTTSEKWLQIKIRIAELHPYEVPCVIKWKVQANEEYERWIKESTI